MSLDRIVASEPAYPSIPKELEALPRLAANLFWTWRPEVKAVFEKIAPSVTPFSPTNLLKHARNLEALAKDAAYVKEVQRVAEAFDDYMAGAKDAWFHHQGAPAKALDKGPVAYFCAEYAFFEGFNQYAGGLGILAGDHCKEASDLDLPFVPVGIFYHRGFFHQMVDWEGRQEHFYNQFDPEQCGFRRALRPKTQEPLTVQVEFEGRVIAAAVYVLGIGRIQGVYLSTDLPENSAEDRAITSQLYNNGRSMRLHQETILGVGGARALEALGIAPSAWHMNEGHSAFLLLDRLLKGVRAGKTLKDVTKAIQANSLITIHTPVPEGNERFDAALAKTLIEPVIKGSGLKVDALLKLGRGADGSSKVFDMTAFALRLSSQANGVSLLHGRTADGTWNEIAGYPVIGVTNGVHMPTWLGTSVRGLLESKGLQFQPETRVDVKKDEGDRPDWHGASALDDIALWDAHNTQKRATLAFIEERLREQHARHGEGPEELKLLSGVLDPDALLVGFARRFAPYKRPSLFFADEKKALRLISDRKRPIQFVFSGKSHPSDRTGQDVVKRVYQLSEHPKFKGRVFYIEDYDMEAGRMLSQGVDVWLNNPRRPLEASGTSGMKAAANGVVNVSILDGWWDEACVDGVNGFAIGDRKVPKTLEKQDAKDASDLFETLEKTVVPLFFDRDSKGLPRKWIQLMKGSIASSIYSFSTERMLRDYLQAMYSVAAKRK